MDQQGASEANHNNSLDLRLLLHSVKMESSKRAENLQNWSQAFNLKGWRPKTASAANVGEKRCFVQPLKLTS